ncbi:MAG: DNA replication/repair protein RecF [Gammaproteobacteria bacterium]|nr:DNA replication/repair protein RecF [Gammaproteobacteria bacterium]
MTIKRLDVRNFRNLQEVTLEPGPAINLIEGPNGSGKTSLLEAIHVAGVGRSFLTHHRQLLIRQGCPEATVFVIRQDQDREERTGVRFSAGGEWEFRRDGERINTRAALAQGKPLAVITPESHALVEGGPKERRSFLDWGLFHVEQDFLEVWRRYQRALRQRNACLAQGAEEASAWTPMLCEAGTRVDGGRRAWVERVAAELGQSPLLGSLPGGVHLWYERGWIKEHSLAEALERDTERDRRDGLTHSGPHRGDMKIRIDDHPASDVLSRGQEKLLVCGLWLAQLVLVREITARAPIVLLDDLPSELDERNRCLLLEALVALGAQVFVTTTDRSLTPTPFSGSRLFHVEQGCITTVV